MSALKLPRFWLTRLHTALACCALALVAAFGNGTMLYASVVASGEAGLWCMLALASLSAVALVDVLVNDLLPESVSIGFAKKHRHFIFMALSIGTASLGAIIQIQVGLNAMHALVYLHATAAAAVAFFDLFARHEK